MKTDDQSQDHKPARNGYAIYYWVLGILIAFAIWSVALSPKPQGIPLELQGVWRTNDPRYSDRSLEISSVHLSVGTGGGTSTSGFIRHVKIDNPGGESEITITYTNDDGENKLQLLYDPGLQVLRLKNQPSITWKKESDS